MGVFEVDAKQRLAKIDGHAVNRRTLRVEPELEHLLVLDGTEDGSRQVGDKRHLPQHERQMLGVGLVLMRALGGDFGEAFRDGGVIVTASLRSLPDRRQHGDDAAALFALGAGVGDLAFDRRRVTRNLMLLQGRVSFRQDGLDQQFGERAQKRKLGDAPSFLLIVARHGVVEIAALIVEAVIVRDALESLAGGRVVLVTDDQPADAALAQQRQGGDDEDRDGPEPDGVFIAAELGEIGADEGQVPQHPHKEPVGIRPDAGCVRDVLLEVAIGVDGGEPVPPGFIHEDGVDLPADFAEQAVAQEAVLAAAGKDCVPRVVGHPRIGGRAVVGIEVCEDEPGLEVILERDGGQRRRFADDERICFQELLDVDFSGGVLGRRVEELLIGPRESAVEDDLIAEEAIVEGNLSRHEFGEIDRRRLFRVEHVLLIGVLKVECVRRAAACHFVRTRQPLLLEFDGSDFKAVNDLKHV